MLESDLVSFFYKWFTVFPAPLVKQIVFTPLYILASFVKDKVSIRVWIYLWAFYFVLLIYISVFVPVPYCLDDCGFVVEPKDRQVDSSSSILLSQDLQAINAGEGVEKREPSYTVGGNANLMGSSPSGFREFEVGMESVKRD